jgi:hypothetical protein
MTDSLRYSQNELSTIYEQLTFQEYINNTMNLHTYGYSEYKKFTNSMQDNKFKANLFLKYEIDSSKKTIKNHIVYIIQLYLVKIIYPNTIFSKEEEICMDFMINAIPFFEHLSNNGWTLCQIEEGCIHTNTDLPVREVQFNTIELKAIQQIHKLI